MHKKVWDTMIMELAVLYVVSPIMIFLLGWVKKPIAVLGCILCIYFQAKLIKELSNGYTEDIKTQRGRLFWVISCLVLVLWVLFSGIGGFSYQTGDFFVRNPMFHDLLDHPWPIYFNLSEQPPLVHEVIGSVHEDTATYVYYFAWWLPVAAFTKLFHVAAAVSDVLLFVWALLGVFLTFYCLVRYFKTYSYWILSAFVLFGGMDFAIYVFTRLEFPNKGHVEWWAGYFQYSASSSQLYWVFNQSIPIWLILSLLLLTYKEKQRLGLCSLAFAYSPFATIGIVPIAVASCLKLKGGGRKEFRQMFRDSASIENVAIPAMMFVIFGSFYMQNKNSLGQTGFLFCIHPEFKAFTVYVVFLVAEVLIYFILVGEYAWNWRYYWVILTELLLIPFYIAGKYNDFAMRASIPAIFFMMVMVLQYLLDARLREAGIIRRKALVAAVIIGYMTSVVELQRNIAITLTSPESEYINHSLPSFQNIQLESENAIKLIFDQYLVTDYKDSFFYKHIAER